MIPNVITASKLLAEQEKFTIVTNAGEVEMKVWSDFVSNHPDGNIFQMPEMYEVYSATVGFDPVFIAILEGDLIKGLMLAVIQTEVTGIAGRFTKRSIIKGGPLIVDSEKEILDLILTQYDSFVKRKVMYTQVRNWTENSQIKNVFKDHEYQFMEHMNILIDLQPPEEQLWLNMKRTKRNRIRKANGENITCRFEDHQFGLIDSYHVLKQVYSKIKLPIPRFEFFANLWLKSFDNARLLIYNAEFEDKVIATRLILAFNQRLYLFYAGALQEYNNKCVNDLMNWELMLWGKREGYQVFDFAGAGNPNKAYGVRKYKMKFGGTIIYPGRYEKVYRPQLFKVVKFGFYVWQWLRKINDNIKSLIKRINFHV